MALTFEDRIALQDLLVRYTQAIDFGCPEAEFVALFTEDAVLVSPFTGDFRGVEGVKKFFGERTPRHGKTQVRHFLTNFLIDGDGDRATLKAYYLHYKTQLELPPGVEPKTEFDFVGNYDCDACKIDGRWKFTRRLVTVDAVPERIRQATVAKLKAGAPAKG